MTPTAEVRPREAPSMLKRPYQAPILLRLAYFRITALRVGAASLGQAGHQSPLNGVKTRVRQVTAVQPWRGLGFKR